LTSATKIASEACSHQRAVAPLALDEATVPGLELGCDLPEDGDQRRAQQKEREHDEQGLRQKRPPHLRGDEGIAALGDEPSARASGLEPPADGRARVERPGAERRCVPPSKRVVGRVGDRAVRRDERGAGQVAGAGDRAEELVELCLDAVRNRPANPTRTRSSRPSYNPFLLTVSARPTL